ncbi:MAG: hypothetical protein HY331_11440 [Chloroflexi bacterium]|nr:hypothetical protein [Chloroflexota bacterium]
MAVVIIMKWEGITPQQYDAARDLVKWESNVPAGGLYHVAAFDQKGLRVVDVWESAEAFQQFAETRLMPGVRQLGLPGEPKVEIYPAHRIFTPGYAPLRRTTAGG